jgi:hypothetical protein
MLSWRRGRELNQDRDEKRESEKGKERGAVERGGGRERALMH